MWNCRTGEAVSELIFEIVIITESSARRGDVWKLSGIRSVRIAKWRAKRPIQCDVHSLKNFAYTCMMYIFMVNFQSVEQNYATSIRSNFFPIINSMTPQ
jgi:hypothetical protein